MWDPFRYKLGGRLLNGNREEFVHKYGATDAGKYVVTRDLATYSIVKEVEAGRGSPHGGAWLSFEHCSEAQLRAAAGPVIDRLAKNGIDLTKQAVEVAPIAHYHMGGVKADISMKTKVPGLFVAGEAVGGANGANRLSGNAITEALVFGRKAGKSAADHALKNRKHAPSDAFASAGARLAQGSDGPRSNPALLLEELQALMQKYVGPFRTDAGLKGALERIASMQSGLAAMKPPPGKPYDTELVDWLDLKTMLEVARCVAASALSRTESRGAHQREDFPGMDPAWDRNQVIA
jgi:succinate dehydrogenase/fumarate reductase flavoprotein subunit